MACNERDGHMKKRINRKIIVALLITAFCCTMFCSCETQDESASLIDSFKLKFKVQSAIGYSLNNDNEWKYGDLTKEFSCKKPCYVRMDLMPITNKRRGVDEEIKAKIQFVGTDNCDVTSSDGIVTPVKTKKDNQKAFEVTLMPQKEQKAETQTYIFKYEPKKQCDMVLKIIFDDNVDPKYDVKSTIYFVK